MLVILPNTLFSTNHIPKDIKEIIIWEHPHYFKKYNYNKKKLILHRASMRSYYDMIKENYNAKYIKYIDYNMKFNYTDYIIFDNIDKIKLPNKYTIIESPNFLLNKDLYKEYYEKNGKKQKVIFNNFYMWSKNKLDLYPELKSQDKLNREKYNETKIPPQPKITINKYNKNNKY